MAHVIGCHLRCIYRLDERQCSGLDNPNRSIFHVGHNPLHLGQVLRSVLLKNPMTIQGYGETVVVRHENGDPVYAGDLKENQTYIVEVTTGILRPKPPRKRRRSHERK